MAGGVSNIIDRIVRGYVVDYIDTPFIATFNFADACIVIGVLLIIISQAKEILKSGSNSK